MTARGVFVAGTDTGVGKTRITVALLQALKLRGVAAVGMKPVASGVSACADAPAGAAQVNEDVALIHAASAMSLTAVKDIADINPYCFDWPVSPHLAARRAGVTIETAMIAAAYARLAGRAEAVVVEGTGGWLAPIGERHTMADIAVVLALPVVLVVGLRLGCLNHALLSAQAIEASGLTLAGWIGSTLDPDMLALGENVASLDQRLPARRLALLPFSVDRAQDASHLAEAAAAALGPASSPLSAS